MKTKRWCRTGSAAGPSQTLTHWVWDLWEAGLAPPTPPTLPATLRLPPPKLLPPPALRLQQHQQPPAHHRHLILQGLDPAAPQRDLLPPQVSIENIV